MIWNARGFRKRKKVDAMGRSTPRVSRSKARTSAGVTVRAWWYFGNAIETLEGRLLEAYVWVSRPSRARSR